MELFVGGFLTVLSIQDIRYKKISFWITIGMVVLGSIYSLMNQRGLYVLLDVIPGCILCMLSMVTSKTIGIGDGLVGIFYGLFFGWKQTCILLMFAFLIVSLVGVVLCIQSRKCSIQIPFIPFLVIVHIGMNL